MNEINPLISVIVPVYNAEKRLVKCIDSILTQSYIHFELLLINDGSKDSSGTICDAYAQKDNRVKVFHKENGGASSARNIGIERATGEYIVFVDSDDYVEKDYLSAFFVDPLNEDKFTFVVQSLKNLYDDGIEIKQSVFKEGLYSEDNFSELFSINEINKKGYSVCKLYNTEIIKDNNLKFNPEVHYCEDLIFMLSYMLFINKVFLTTGTHYNYISTEGSLSKNYNSYESELLAFKLLKQSFNQLVNKFRLDNKAKDSFNKFTLGAHLQRSILTIYRPNNKKHRKKRLSILRELYNYENVECLEKYTLKGLKINRIGYLLYKRKQFEAFDIFYSVVYSLRYKMDRLWQKYLKRRNKKIIKNIA